MKKYFVLFLLLLIIPIRVVASEKLLINYIDDMDRNVSEVITYGKIEYKDKEEEKDNFELLDASVFSNNQATKSDSSNPLSDVYMLVIVISLVAVVLSSSKRFIDIGR